MIAGASASETNEDGADRKLEFHASASRSQADSMEQQPDRSENTLSHTGC
ncbi:MAG: hypothetical protein AAGD07_10590 [Planctomycetota bacterium]